MVVVSFDVSRCVLLSCGGCEDSRSRKAGITGLLKNDFLFCCWDDLRKVRHLKIPEYLLSVENSTSKEMEKDTIFFQSPLGQSRLQEPTCVLNQRSVWLRITYIFLLHHGNRQVCLVWRLWLRECRSKAARQNRLTSRVSSKGAILKNNDYGHKIERE